MAKKSKEAVKWEPRKKPKRRYRKGKLRHCKKLGPKSAWRMH